MKTIIITIGDEVTSGHIVNTNAAWMARAIEALGLTPERVLTLGDDIRTLAKEIKSAWRSHDLILVTGGLGPTHDDVTKPALAKAFGVKIVRDRKAHAGVAAYFRKLGKQLSPANECQADVPEGFKAIASRFGTAPLLMREEGGRFLFSMAGVPFEMKNLMETEVIPRLKKRLPKQAMARTVIHTAGIAESTLYSKMTAAKAMPENVQLAFLPSLGRVDLRLTAQGDTAAKAAAKLARARKAVLKVAGEYAFGADGVTLEGAIGERLAEKKLTLACAESCTGGLFASRITATPGASRYFLEGVVTYCNNSKIKRLGVEPSTLLKYGAVSAQTAAEMAEGICAHSGADIGVSATGVAGPTGGTPDKPVGLAYAGMCVNGIVETREFHFGEDRARNQERTVNEMLLWLWSVVK
ncbi:MAG: CinA family nicotinamide mononucleotide deamidase-related protein [Nitrospinae bacterium]|nr:CinA family nicotinamide mononucleotide deamidase-related protein [Nitrospinota bacterium]